jgi:peptidoglycan/LPS O-acetylase OafA/YrhL
MRRQRLALAAEVRPLGHHYQSLTGVRALAAYLIFWHHLNPLATRGAGRPALEWASHFLQQCHIGVPIFFVLSGFLLTHRYADTVVPRWAWAKTYLQNRFARVYPLYAILTTITLVVQFSALKGYNAPDLRAMPLSGQLLGVFLNFTLLKGLFSRFILATGVGAAWSLSVELLFYLSLPLALLFARRRVGRLVSYPVGALVLGGLLVTVCAHLPFYAYGLLDSLRFMLNCTFFGRCSEFACGMALAFYLRQAPWQVGRGGWCTLSGGLWMLGCTIALTHLEWNHPRDASGIQTYAGIVVNNLLLPPGITLFLAGLLREQTSLRGLLETKVAEVLGQSSYAFYLLHNGLLRQLSGQFMPNSVVLFLITIVLAIVVFYGVEAPLHRCLYVPARRNPTC